MWKTRQKPALPNVYHETYNVSHNGTANPKFRIPVPLIKGIQHLRGIIMKPKPRTDYNNFIRIWKT